MKALWLLIFSSVLFFQYSCSTEPEENYVAYKIKVDNITHPDTISITDTLIIKFYGFVGPDGCHRFTHVEEHKKTDQLEITVWGSRPNFETVCPTVLVYLDGKEYKTVLNQIGTYQIRVNQPDDSFLNDSVYVQ
jgi:hypothetical protein